MTAVAGVEKIYTAPERAKVQNPARDVKPKSSVEPFVFLRGWRRGGADAVRWYREVRELFDARF